LIPSLIKKNRSPKKKKSKVKINSSKDNIKNDSNSLNVDSENDIYSDFVPNIDFWQEEVEYNHLNYIDSMKTVKCKPTKDFMDIEKLMQSTKESNNYSQTLTNNLHHNPRGKDRKSIIDHFQDLRISHPTNYNSSTTSSLTVEVIRKELKRTFAKCSIIFEETEVVFNCNTNVFDENIEFTVEIVNLETFKNVKGISIKRINGSEDSFNEIKTSLESILQL